MSLKLQKPKSKHFRQMPEVFLWPHTIYENVRKMNSYPSDGYERLEALPPIPLIRLVSDFSLSIRCANQTCFRFFAFHPLRKSDLFPVFCFLSVAQIRLVSGFSLSICFNYTDLFLNSLSSSVLVYRCDSTVLALIGSHHSDVILDFLFSSVPTYGCDS